MEDLRKIIHVDMDAFYASVEMNDNPELRTVPLVVGGSPFSRGVVCTANYEARKFGVRSAMPCFQAYRLCPKAVFVKPRFQRYKEVSEHIHSIFSRYTDLIEPLSLDEAFLDVTSSHLRAVQVAQNIRRDIFTELGLTASAGVSINKLVAKVASDHNKPNGITIVLPEQVKEFIGAQSVRKIPGVGPKMEANLQKMGMNYCKDGWKYSEEEFADFFGKWGRDLWFRFQGVDHRKVSTDRIRKSVGQEETFSEDVISEDAVMRHLQDLCAQTFSLLQRKNKKARTLTIKVKYHDFKQITRAYTHLDFFSPEDAFNDFLAGLLKKTECGARAVRLLGVSFSNLEDIDSKTSKSVIKSESH
jgi:DNA polymerase IV